MAVARVTTVTASSGKGFQDAIEQGLKRASATLRGITGLEILEQKCKVDKGKIGEWRVRMNITFILE